MPVYTTSMPASRSARATTFAPRSCPSRPGLAIITLILCSSAMCGQTSPYGDYIARHKGGARLAIGVAEGFSPARQADLPMWARLGRSQLLRLPPLDQLQRDPVRGGPADARHPAARPDARLRLGDPRALRLQIAHGGVQVVHLNADRKEALAALLELLGEAPLLP